MKLRSELELSSQSDTGAEFLVILLLEAKCIVCLCYSLNHIFKHKF